MIGSKNKKYPRVKCVCIDVDGTIIQNGRLNKKLAEWASRKRDSGFEVILWSAQGKEHAEKVAAKYGIEKTFSAIISKPGYIVDDLGWSWTKYTKVIRNLI